MKTKTIKNILARVSVLILVSLLLPANCKTNKSENKNILFVLTTHDALGDTDKKTGAYISEIAHPYEILSSAGYQIDFAGPKGGKTPLDGMDALDEITKKLLNDSAFMNKLNNIKKLSEVKSADYAAVYFAGGHGTMYDLPDNQDVQRITAGIYEGGGVVAAVCHGPAALVNVKLSSGKYLIEGKNVSGFTNDEEEAVGLTKAMPFLLETKLKSRGARYTKTENFKEHVVVSERLLTGQNPASATGVGAGILKLLKK